MRAFQTVHKLIMRKTLQRLKKNSCRFPYVDYELVLKFTHNYLF
jgi:hypothetical protein